MANTKGRCAAVVLLALGWAATPCTRGQSTPDQGSDAARMAIEAVERRATTATVRALAAYPSAESTRVLLDVIEHSSSRVARSEACDVLTSFFERRQDATAGDALGVALVALAIDTTIDSKVRDRTIRAIVHRTLSTPAFTAGTPMLDVATSEDPDLESARRRVRAAIQDWVAERPADADRLAQHAHAAVRAATEVQIKQWRKLHESLPYVDIATMLEWKDRRLSAVAQQIAATQQIIRDRPEQKDDAMWGFREAPTKRLERLKRLERDLRRAPIIEFAAYQIVSYQNAMREIAEGEQRALQRVDAAYEPRSSIELTFDEFEWEQRSNGSYDKVKTGESSFSIDFDEILGPKPEPTDEQLAALRRPDSMHRTAIAMAYHSIQQLYRLSPEAVDLAMAHFCAQRGIRAEQAIRLPARH